MSEYCKVTRHRQQRSGSMGSLPYIRQRVALPPSIDMVDCWLHMCVAYHRRRYIA